MILSNLTIQTAASFGAAYPGAERVIKHEGKGVFGITFPCYEHPETNRDDYPPAEPECIILLNDKRAYHLDVEQEVWFHEEADWFRYRARKYHQPWRGLKDVVEAAEVELRRPWIWAGMLKQGTITLLGGPPKLGKTTVIFDFLYAMATSQPTFLGMPMSKANVLYVTEEGEVPLAIKHQLYPTRLGPLAKAGYMAFLTAEDAGESWDDMLKLLERAVQELPSTPGFLPPGFPLLVVIDTIGFYMDAEDENSSAQTRAQIKTLVKLVRRYNFAALLIHHTRKGSSDKYGYETLETLRGSSAFAGNVDTLAVLGGDGNNNQRWLFRIGRLFPNPDQPLQLRYTDAAGYEVLTETEWVHDHADLIEQIAAVYLIDADASERKVTSETGIAKTTAHRLKPYAKAMMAGEPMPVLWEEEKK
ncbi:hypothetical protein LCGC14_0657720 [marine sediment metagenome]|uniref:AAA+ ATPase domain-containing protein n=1 Tax=marine sediment metagenome TaxID=412755 RepID=A0A0F9U2V3_9ZZZZ